MGLSAWAHDKLMIQDLVFSALSKKKTPGLDAYLAICQTPGSAHSLQPIIVHIWLDYDPAL